MTIAEVIAELQADTKVYVLVRMNKQTFWETIRRIRLGKAKPSTITKFFNTFNYFGEYNQWEKWPVNE